MYGNHFTFQELTRTDTGMDNSVSTDSHLANLAALWNYLNYLRERLNAPIIINSAYRTPAVNKQVGGAKRSLHMQGRAADIRAKYPADMPKLWKLIQEDKDDLAECIKYDTFYHIAL